MDEIYIEKLYKMYSSMYEDWIKAIKNYKITYEKQSGIEPNVKLLIAFCKLRRIPYPLPNKEDYINDMVEKHKKVGG